MAGVILLTAHGGFAEFIVKKPRKYPELEQSQAFIRRLRQYYPEIEAKIFHIPNESRFSYHPDSGVKPGVPDFMLPIARDGKHGLFLEFKKPSVSGHKNGGCSDAQVARINQLIADGYQCYVVYDWEEALEIAIDYFHGAEFVIPTKS